MRLVITMDLLKLPTDKILIVNKMHVTIILRTLNPGTCTMLTTTKTHQYVELEYHCRK